MRVMSYGHFPILSSKKAPISPVYSLDIVDNLRPNLKIGFSVYYIKCGDKLFAFSHSSSTKYTSIPHPSEIPHQFGTEKLGIAFCFAIHLHPVMTVIRQSSFNISINLDDSLFIYGEFGVIYLKNIETDLFYIYRQPVKSVVKTTDAIFILSNDKSIYFTSLSHINWGKLECEAGNVKTISTGYEHVALLSEDGTIYMAGSGTRGQMGSGFCEKFRQDFERVAFFSSHNLTDVACGGWHTIAIDDTGSIFSWGWNESGQCGVEEKEMGLLNESLDTSNYNISSTTSATPSPVQIPKSNKRTIVVTPEQLNLNKETIKVHEESIKRNSVNDTEYFESYKNFNVVGLDLKIVKISAGARHSIVIDSYGNIWCWGHNEFGQCMIKVSDKYPPNIWNPVLFKNLFPASNLECGMMNTLLYQ